jgi:hypothetical protein
VAVCHQTFENKQKITYFFDVPKRETFMDIILKSHCYIFILSVHFAAKSILCTCAILCSLAGQLFLAKSGLADDFPQITFSGWKWR